MVDRAKVVAYATKYWWRPCEDGIVWVGYGPIDVAKKAKEAKKAKDAKEEYVGVFLWYPGKDGSQLEALCLVPKSKEKEIETKNGEATWDKYKSDAIALASWANKRTDKEEDLTGFGKTPPPDFGLNDCTHFTSECLIAGGLSIKDEKAHRGAGVLANFLDASKETATLCWMAAHDDVKAVVDAGIVKAGDVFAYHNDTKHAAHHTVPAVSPTTIAMHTWHAFGRPWHLDEPDQRVSVFHFKDDDYSTAEAKKWPGWWKVEATGDPKRTKPEFYHFDDKGVLTVTDKQPKDEKVKPQGEAHRWFSTKPKTAVVVRRKGTETKVETFTLSDPKPKDPSVTADGALSNPPKGAKVSFKGTKIV